MELDTKLALYAGTKTRELRQKNKMNQSQLANLLGLTTATISKYENGTQIPKLSMLFALSDIFNVSVDEFFPNKEEDVSENEKAIENPRLELDKEAGIEIHESMEGSLERQESYLISLLQVQNGILTELKQIRKYLEDKNNG